MMLSPIRAFAACLLLLLLVSRDASADLIEWREDASIAQGPLGTLAGRRVRYVVKTQFSISDYYETSLGLHWTEPGSSQEKNQLLFEGLGTAAASDYRFTATGDGFTLAYPSGNRFESESQRTDETWRWDSKQGRFVKTGSHTTSPYAQATARIEKALARGDLSAARNELARLGEPPEAGPTPPDALWFTRFLEATHRKATELHKRGELEAAAALVASLIHSPPVHSSLAAPDKKLFILCAGASRRQECGRTFNALPPTPEMAARLDDLAFFLEQGGYDAYAEPLLRQVLQFHPERLPAWLHLADALWDLDETAEAREFYARYLERMKQQKDGEKQLPPRVRERLAHAP
jgi:tetratricopeptide (TPR) repeat protein